MRPIAACVFAKAPVPGQVKTRLAQSLGPEKAAALAAAMLQDVWRTVCHCPGLSPILATVDRGTFPIDVPPQDIWLQEGSDLGLRIENILRQALSSSPAALAIGADSPLLTVSHLSRAQQALTTHDGVLGGCPDGGFYLLGLNRCPAGLLADLPWSTSDTAAAVRRRLRDTGFTLAELPVLFDVDTVNDLPILSEALAHDLSLAPATRLVLEHAR